MEKENFIRIVFKEVHKPPKTLFIFGDTLQKRLSAVKQLIGPEVTISHLCNRDSSLSDNIIAIHLKNDTGCVYNIYDIKGPVAIIKHNEKRGFHGLDVHEAAIITKKVRNAKVFGKPLFEVGDVYVSQLAHSLLAEEEIIKLLKRHSYGDWGDVADDSIALNTEGIKTRDNILSKYTVGDNDFFVITDAGHETTTIELTEEYWL